MGVLGCNRTGPIRLGSAALPGILQSEPAGRRAMMETGRLADHADAPRAGAKLQEWLRSQSTQSEVTEPVSGEKVIAMINMKGGVGKTTLSVNLAYALAQRRSKRVLLVDVDPQFNATQYLVSDDAYLEYVSKRKNTVCTVFFDRVEPAIGTVSRRPARARILPTIANTTIRVFSDGSAFLDLVPSELRLHEADRITRGGERRLAAFLREARDAYDFILIDCPPTISVFTLSAYLASDGYLVPVKPDPLSTVGLPLLEKVVSQYAADQDHQIRQIGIIPTMVRDTNLMRDTLSGLRRARTTSVFKNHTSYSTKVAESVEAHKPLFDIPAASKYGEEILKITDEFLASVA
jgi:chromosome partitioning protein